MKKIKYLAFAFSSMIVVSACSSNEEVELSEAKYVTVQLGVNTEEEATRLVSHKDGMNHIMSWESGDLLNVYSYSSSSSYPKTFTFQSIQYNDSRYGSFTGSVDINAQSYYILYPNQQNTHFEPTNNENRKGKVVASVPVDQYGRLGSFDHDAALHFGYVTSPNPENGLSAHLFPLCTLFKIQLGDNIKLVRLNSPTDDWKLAGTVDLVESSGGARIEFNSSYKASQSNSVTLHPSNGDYFKPGMYLIATAPSTQMPGLTLQVLDKDNNDLGQSTQNTLTFNAGIVYNLGTYGNFTE